MADRNKEIEQVAKYAERKLQNAPDGYLINKNGRYYLKDSNAEVFEKYLGKKEETLIKALEEKAYYQQLLKAAEEESAGLKKINKIQSKITHFEDVYLNIPEYRRHLIKPYVNPECEAVQKKVQTILKEWEKAKNSKRGVPKNINLVTLNGERVRSKSELIIADRLKNAGVPYYYEGKYIFSDAELNSKKSAFDSEYDVWFPDFQVLNTRTGELLFWEHFGIMDDPEYCASALFKIETYAKHGFTIGKNLIFTMESSQHSLNVEYVDKLIKDFLL